MVRWHSKGFASAISNARNVYRLQWTWVRINCNLCRRSVDKGVLWSFSRQQELFRVLKAYSILYPEDGYFQGQAPVAAMLIMHMPAEDAFWCLVAICEKYLPGYYSQGLVRRRRKFLTSFPHQAAWSMVFIYVWTHTKPSKSTVIYWCICWKKSLRPFIGIW